MTGASKILTVSYGTFSCTLEGFDDPFNTMKAIAEYFRDLAAEDRYFGAEPPQPDAAMLHRIAEREIQRRVEAKIGENGVVLHANPDMPTAALAPVVPSATPPTAAEARRPAPQLVEDEDGEVGASVVEKLSQLRRAAAPVAEAVDPVPVVVVTPENMAEPVLPVVQEPLVIIEEPAELEVEPAAMEPATSEPATSEPAHTEADLSPADALSTVAETPAQASVQPVMSEEDEAVLARLGTLIDPEEASEDPASAYELAEVPAPVDAGLENILSALADDLPPAPARPDALAGPMAKASAVLVEPDLPDVELAEAEVAEVDLAPEAVLPPVVEHLAPAAQAPAAPVDAPLRATIVEEPAQPTEAIVPVPRRPVRPMRPIRPADAPAEETAQPLPAPVPAPEVANRAERARARIIRIRRGDTPAQSVAAPMGSTLSPDAEAALRAELAALARGEAPKDTPTTAPIAASPARLSPAAEEAVDRLMQEASTQMEGPESRRRQSAIQHLKAAVAATRADQQVGGPRKDDGSRMEPYRSALAEVVKPTPAAPAAPLDRPAPLVLVSAQRIDRPAEPAPVAPIAPRRPIRAIPAAGLAPLAFDDEMEDEVEDETTAQNIFGEQATSFAEFAERLGARTLAETMEAAAAYMTTVEGRDTFTRPQLLGYVGANHAGVAREDSLRSFGVLLREGRIQKNRRGQFAISAASPLLAKAKNIAG